MVVDRLAAATAEYSNQVQGKNQSTAAAAKSAASTQAKQTAGDTTSFKSSATNSVQTLSKVAVQTTPSRQARVEALRQAVKSAQYQLDSAKIAQSLANSI